MANARVLVSDPLAEEGLVILRAAVDVDVKTGLAEDELCKIIGDYDAGAQRHRCQRKGD
jgi:D-3-phosphoglycerate dehydrogenase